MNLASRITSLLVLTATVLVATLPAKSEAVPAWSRKYKMACTFCHFGGSNKLTKFGAEFQHRGFRMTDEASVKEPAEINLANYASFSTKFRYVADSSSTPSTKFDFDSLALYMAGPLYDNFNFFTEMYLFEKGKFATSGGGLADTATRVKLAESYLQYNTNPQGDNYMTFRAGSITPHFIYRASTGGRYSISRPFAWNSTAGDGNLFLPRDRFYGISFGGASKSGTEFEVGYLNGGGSNNRPNLPEMDETKDIFGSISQRLDERGSYIGAYATKGSFLIPATATTPAFDDTFDRLALVGEYIGENFTLTGAFTSGKHHNKAGGTRTLNANYLEVGFNLSPTGTAFLRFDNFDNGIDPRMSAWLLGYSHRLSSLGRLVVEFQQTKTTGKTAVRTLGFELNVMF